MGEDGDRTDGEVGLEAGRDAVRSATGGRGDGASNGDAQGVARSTQRADRGRQTRTAHTQDYGSTAGNSGAGSCGSGRQKGELLGRDTRRTHIVKLADVVA